MKFTIGRKLLLGNIFLILFLLIIVVVATKSIKNLSKTADNMEIEYIEVSAVQELRISYIQFITSVKDYLISKDSTVIDKFEHYSDKTKKILADCKKIITERHNRNHLEKFEEDVLIVESLSHKIFKLYLQKDSTTIEILLDEINSISDKAIFEITEISAETKSEMSNYIKENKITNKKGISNIHLMGIISAVSLLVGAYFFVRAIIRPLKELTLKAQKISTGNQLSIADIKASDEIGNLTTSFNNMIGVLDRTTVSRDYFNNILSRISDSLIITDSKLNILIVNQATLDLLGYNEDEIIGKSYGKIIGEKNNKNALSTNSVLKELTDNKHVFNLYNIYYSKTGDKIPVLFSGSTMQNEEESITGLICIANTKVDREKSQTFNDNGSEALSINSNKETPLTKREREILRLIANDLSNKEIADILFLSVRTVETHRKNIMQKLHIKSVVALIKYANLNGIT